jgi:hypothetical protein
MSKKKNTLKDLDEFLKQQAATLVAPEKLSEKVKDESGEAAPTQQASTEITPEKVLNDLQWLAKNSSTFRKEFYDLIVKTVETQAQPLPEDKMLINTALYLKSGDRWKDVIRDYWKNNK